MRLIFLGLLVASSFAEDARPLAGTLPLVPEDDRSAQMVEGISRWLERETARLATARGERWRAETAGAGWNTFVPAESERLRKMLGAVDARVPGVLEEIRPVDTKQSAASGGGWTVRTVRWPVLDGVFGEGLLFVPAGEPQAAIIAVPDADQPPEDFALARRLAAQGCVVLAPILVDRRDTWSGNEALKRFTNQPHREWIYRQAFEVGRTLIGYEVQKLLAAADALEAMRETLRFPVGALGVVGYGEGGLLALHAGALDERFRAAWVCGYFEPRERMFAEPIYRNLFGFVRDFGDAELATLIAPRAVVIEHGGGPEITGPPAAREGRRGAAPGVLRTPEQAAGFAEADRAAALIEARRPLGGTLLSYASTNAAPSEKRFREAMRLFLQNVGGGIKEEAAADEPLPLPSAAVIDARQHRAVRELERHTQRLVHETERVRREKFWSKVKPGAEWEASQAALRTALENEVIGKVPGPFLPPHPRTRVVRETEKWTAYEVVLDVLPDVFAWGWLLVPKDLKPDERRPVVVCQHGLEGLPEDTVNDDPKSQAFGYYKAFAAKLAERGFITYAPHNPYRGKDNFRMLQRRANPIGLSLFSFIVAQHAVATDWLATLPFVDPKRIGFYGLSYGGKTAMRVPALVPRYCLSICSGDFNEWVRKNVSVEEPINYMFTNEWEMPEWNLASVANYAEMAMLIAPRPFMVERGHDDGVGLDEWVAYEYAKVQRGYVKLGIGDRTQIEWFDGPHTINGVGTFEFLHKHLAWPAK